VQQKIADSGLDELYITDTIAVPEREELDFKNLKTYIVSVAQLIAEQIKD
jgi:phosphoribosylpyrophosphate synthetase